ncbi:tRNA(His) guanylyltransferase-like protein, partial [Leptotrombidium deliense]
MAVTKYAYVREYEVATEHFLLKNSFIVVRLDGHNFHKFVQTHNFFKPNDKRGLDLMVESAKEVMREFYPNIPIAYGQSDEFSFIFKRDAKMHKRRQNKITSILVSVFTSAYVFNWNKYFNSFSENESHLNVELKYPPSFDARCVLYSTIDEVIDYMKWRQVDCHINNLYNTTLSTMTGEYTTWPLPDNRPKDTFKFYTSKEATKKLSGTVKKDKHEIMFTDYH